MSKPRPGECSPRCRWAGKPRARPGRLDFDAGQWRALEGCHQRCDVIQWGVGGGREVLDQEGGDGAGERGFECYFRRRSRQDKAKG